MIGDGTEEQIAAFHRIYEDIKSDVDHYDDWSEMGEDADDRFRLSTPTR